MFPNVVRLLPNIFPAPGEFLLSSKKIAIRNIRSVVLCCLVWFSMNSTLQAQAPQKMSYQAVIRNASQALLSNQNIGMKISILQGSASGTIVYVETQTATTNSNGLVSLEIGTGTPITGTFSGISWANGPYFIKTETDPNGGNNYSISATTQLLSIPYALFAQQSANGLMNGTSAGNTLRWNGTTWVADNALYNHNGNIGIGTSAPSTQLHTTGSVRHQALSGSGSRAVYADSAGRLQAITTASGFNNTPVAIPDNSCTGVTSTLTVTGGAISMQSKLLSVTIDITHTYVGDLRIYLIDPFGNTINLAFNNGSMGDNFSQTTFSDYASTSLVGNAAPFTGNFKPTGNMTTFCGITPNVSTFGAIGGGIMNPNLTWTLRIFDMANNDVGTLNSWSVQISNVINGSTNFLPKWDNQKLSATSMVYDDGSHVGIGTTSPTATFHTKGHVRLEGLKGAGTRPVFADEAGNLLTPQTITLTNTTSGSITDNSCTVLSRTLTVSELPVSVPGAGISVTLNATHPNPKELWIALESPDGKIINLSQASGFSSLFPNLSNLTIGDTNYFPFGSYPNAYLNIKLNPDGSLTPVCGITPTHSSFASLGNLNPNGVWTLYVMDRYAGNSGSLTNWSLVVNTLVQFSDHSMPKWVNSQMVPSSISDLPTEVAIEKDVDIDGNLVTHGKCSINGGSSYATLVVGNANMTSASGNRVFFTQAGGTSLQSASTGYSGGVSLMAYGGIWSHNGGFYATSDDRIKHKIGLSNSKSDLEKLNQLQITEYRYIDHIGSDSRVHKKVIAQQVQSVYPEAINEEMGVIPNVYEVAEQVSIVGKQTVIKTHKPHQFLSGDTVKLIIEHVGDKYLPVHVMDEHTFSVNEPIQAKVFVYGKQIHDLLNVDYDALSMLNVSATQELYRMIKQLQNDNQQLKEELSLLNQSVMKKIQALEAKLYPGTQSIETVSK